MSAPCHSARSMKSPMVDVPDTSTQPFGEVIRDAIRRHPESLHPDPSVDAPPFTEDWWWLAWIETGDQKVILRSCSPAQHFYGIEANGRVRFESVPSQITVADLVRAID